MRMINGGQLVSGCKQQFQRICFKSNKSDNFYFGNSQILLFFTRNTQHMTNNFTRKKIENYSYGLNDVIGKGYSSHVYKGRHDQTNQNVAVKVIDLRLLKNEINKILLQSQIQVLKELKCLPHILSLHEVYTTKNNTYIITELCESDFSKLIKKGVPEAEAISFMQQIIIGYLNFAKKQIIHRDLKPANILVAENQLLKIADFGFAIKVNDAAKSNKYNVGSPLYMAPESLKKNQYTLKTDIWALGVIFYEILTGETPWKAKNEKELVRKIQNEKIQDLLVKINIGSTAKDFLRKTLRVDKNSRMDLSELEQFRFGQSTGNILAEKKLNVEMRSINLGHNMSMFTPKTQKSIENRLFIQRSNQNRKTSKDYSHNKFNSFRNQSINHSIQLKPAYSHKYSPSAVQIKKRELSKENPQGSIYTNLQPTLRAPELKPENKNQRKFVSKILVSQIHFCRFLFKLLNKIEQSFKKGMLHQCRREVQNIMTDYTSIIKHKIDNLVRFNTHNFINTSYYEEYKESSDYTKLMKIAKQYKDRYSSELKQYWKSTFKPNFSESATTQLIQQLFALLKLKQHHEEFIQIHSKEIIILDYLITAKQLIDLLKNGENFEKFARKSRIQEIVQGKTADITRELFGKIMSRAKQVAVRGMSVYNYQYEDKMNLLMV